MQKHSTKIFDLWDNLWQFITLSIILFVLCDGHKIQWVNSPLQQAKHKGRWGNEKGLN